MPYRRTTHKKDDTKNQSFFNLKEFGTGVSPKVLIFTHHLIIIIIYTCTFTIISNDKLEVKTTLDSLGANGSREEAAMH